MPLPPPAAPREHLHTRQVECRGYRRADGLWDVEGHLLDRKTHPEHAVERGTIAPGEPIHDMWLRLTVDGDLTIRAVAAAMDLTPYRICPSVAPNFQRLYGLTIGPGFLAKVRHLLGRTEGCTHLVELIGPVATTAFQTIQPQRWRPATNDAPARPELLDSCHAYARDGAVVRREWPQFYTGPAAGSDES